MSLRLGDFAAVAALSPEHLARAFRNVLGISLHRYVLHRRLRLARDLLRSSAESVQLIAKQCGFADDAHLAKTYKTDVRNTAGRQTICGLATGEKSAHRFRSNWQDKSGNVAPC